MPRHRVHDLGNIRGAAEDDASLRAIIGRRPASSPARRKLLCQEWLRLEAIASAGGAAEHEQLDAAEHELLLQALSVVRSVRLTQEQDGAHGTALAKPTFYVYGREHGLGVLASADVNQDCLARPRKIEDKGSRETFFTNRLVLQADEHL